MENSPLRKLPAELRNEVYEMVLYEPTAFEMVSSHLYYGTSEEKGLTTPDSEKVRARSTLALTNTCREIRQESITIFYAVNTFRLQWPLNSPKAAGQWSPTCKTSYIQTMKAARTWLRRIGSPSADAITHLHVVFAGGEVWKAGKRPAYWWNEARKVEKEVIHRAMKPAVMFIELSIVCCSIDWKLAPRVHFFTSGTTDGSSGCESALKECCAFTFLLPTSDTDAYVAAVEKTLEKQRAKIATIKEEVGCCVTYHHPKLVQGVEQCKALLLKAIGK